jgi:hypothetical protein
VGPGGHPRFAALRRGGGPIALFAAVLSACGGPGPMASGPTAIPHADPSMSAGQASLLPLPEPPVAADGEPQLTCGGVPFSAAVLRSPKGAERADHPAASALSEAMRTHDVPSTAGWRIAALSGDAALFLLERSRPDGTSSWWRAEFALGAGGWSLVDAGTCEPGPSFGHGCAAATWALAPAMVPRPTTTLLHVLVTERECASGRSAEGRVADPAIAVDAGSVTIYFAVKVLPGGGRCPGNPPLRVDVELPEALGNRILLDGGAFPPEQRWP